MGLDWRFVGLDVRFLCHTLRPKNQLVPPSSVTSGSQAGKLLKPLSQKSSPALESKAWGLSLLGAETKILKLLRWKCYSQIVPLLESSRPLGPWWLTKQELFHSAFTFSAPVHFNSTWQSQWNRQGSRHHSKQCRSFRIPRPSSLRFVLLLLLEEKAKDEKEGS